MVGAQDAIEIYRSLAAHGIPVWLTGGWGIDALLGEQTRPHKDLDLIMRVDDVAPMQDLLGRAGYALEELWSENRWTVDSEGNKVPTAFVLQDSAERQVDAHAMRFDEEGRGIPAWAAETIVFRREDLAGEGLIAGVAVRCISAEMQVVCHTGYDLPDVQVGDLALLRERRTTIA
ncbi:MAG: nucleotidyltransferase family protein [Anaerolineae bacterium]|jgi:lincosamide nucleotidyltransferase A/C/D/E